MHITAYIFRRQRLKKLLSVNRQLLRHDAEDIEMPRRIRIRNLFLHE